MLPSIGANAELITPQFPGKPALFGLHSRILESPLAAKKRDSVPHAYSEVQINAVDVSSRSVSSEDGPLRPLKLPVSTRSEVHQDTIEEDQALPREFVDDLVSISQADVDAATSEPATAETNTSSEVESLRSVPKPHLRVFPSIPQSISRWLEATSPKRSEARGALEFSHREQGLEGTRKRLAQFTQTQSISLPRLEPYVHEQLGRVLRPCVGDEYCSILSMREYPDDLYPWSLARQPVDAKHVQTRLRELEMIERYLEGVTSSSEDDRPPPKVDTADAMVALRSKKRSRRKIRQLTLEAKTATKTAPTTTAQSFGKRAGKGPAVTVPKVTIVPDSEMDVDKDNGEVACICKGPDDGRRMIQCDNCHSWLHVDCVTREEERSQLPDKWYCWKCPVGTAPERVSTDVQPILVATIPEYSKNIQHDTAADVPVYQASEKQQASPGMGSYAPDAKEVSASLLESRSNGSPTSPPLLKEWTRYPYNTWTEGDMVRHANDRMDDPMTAIASTPFIGSSFASPYGSYDDPSFDPPPLTPNRNFGLRFAPPASATPKKDRPWTNYIGSFATPMNSTGPQLSSNSAQVLPIVQTDPLFIHYEHDAPKQTAHHHGRNKRKVKPKEKDTLESDKGDDGSVQAPPDSADSSNTDEIGPFSDSGTAEASTPIGSQD